MKKKLATLAILILCLTGCSVIWITKPDGTKVRWIAAGFDPKVENFLYGRTTDSLKLEIQQGGRSSDNTWKAIQMGMAVAEKGAKK